MQSIHAGHEAGIYLSKKQKEPNSLVVCSVPNEQTLLKTQKFLKSKGIRTVLFKEPDIGNQYTALASEPVYGDKRKAFSSFPLWKVKRKE